MNKYTIKFEVNAIDDSSYFAIPIVEKIQQNECFGDQIGIYKESGGLEFNEDIDVDDEDVRDFVKTYFKDYRAVLGFIRKITEYHKG